MISPGEEIPLDNNAREGLGREISNYIDDLESTYSTYFQDIATWWKWYEATPLIKGQKNFPFVGASNIVVPLIRIMVDADVNRMYAAMFRSSNVIWTLRTEREETASKVKNLGRFLNWAAAGNDFNFRLPAYDNILESRVVGASVMGLNWKEDVSWAYMPTPGKKVRAVKVLKNRGAHPEHIPREQMMWDTNFNIQDAPFVCRELHYTWSDMRARSELDPSWNAEVIESLRGHAGLEGPSQVVQREHDSQDSRSQDVSNLSGTHDLRECHIDWPIIDAMGFNDSRVARPGKESMDTPSIPLVATIHRKTRKIVRLIAEPYFFTGKPFYDIYYRKRVGRGHSVGMGKMLEGMQRGMSASLNQSIDARTRANAVWAKTNDKTFLDRPLNPAAPILVKDMKGFEPLNLPTSTFDDQRMLTVINTIAERLTGQSDPAMGRDTRQGGHPSPARSTMALMQQSDLMQGTSKELTRVQYSRMGEGILSLYQQFEANEDGKLQRVLGQGDAADVEDFLFPEDPVSSAMEFDVLALSNDNNPEQEMQKALVVTQMNQTYWMSVIKAMTILENPQVGPMTKKAVLHGIKAGTKIHERFLEAGDVDDIERFVLALGNNEQASQADFDEASQRTQEIARGRAGPTQPGLGIGPGGPMGGAAGEPRIGGRIGDARAA